MATIFAPEDRPSIFNDHKTSFTVTNLHVREVTDEHIDKFLETRGDSSVIGCSAMFRDAMRDHVRMYTLSFATAKKILHIHLPSHQERLDNSDRPVKLDALEKIVKSDELVVVGCNLEHVAVGLFLDASEMQVTNFIDLHSLNGRSERKSLKNYLWVLGGESALHAATVRAIFEEVPLEDDSAERSGLRAWASCIAATRGLAGILTDAKKMNIMHLAKNDMRIISKIHRDAVSLDTRKPKSAKNEITDQWRLQNTTVEGEEVTILFVNSHRFSTRLRAGNENDPSTNQVVQIADDNGEIVDGVVIKTQGRQAQIKLPRGTIIKSIQIIQTVGKDALTQAERKKDAIIFQALQGGLALTPLKSFRAIWFPSVRPTARPCAIPEGAVSVQLNATQKQAVLAILKDPLPREVDVQLVVGPPGSGKTSVIGAAVQALMAVATIDKPRYVWLAAQSNVAVKNIARKLADINFMDFKLLVSNEFFFDWHEHLYEKVRQNMICGKDFPATPADAAKMLGGVRVILCTLSMLSHNKLVHVTKQVPIETLIIDEASQIERGDLMAPLVAYHQTLRKMAYVGDDNQLAPFGQDDLPKLESVFETDILRKRAVFLNTQYRMPVSIGTFISNQVYKGQLKSSHTDTRREACQFVDVYNSLEEQIGNSWINRAEIKTAIGVARILHAEEKDFRIITPYDAQRSEVESALKASGIPWQDRVFNVDSFQGNEAPYIILTLVRTERIGFLYNKRRTNVMLTRCQQGLIIISSREFLLTKAERTLAGLMAIEWQQNADKNQEELWIGWKRVQNGLLEPGEDDEYPPSEDERPRSKKPGAQKQIPADSWGGTQPDGHFDWSTGDKRDSEDWSQPASGNATASDWSTPPPARGTSNLKVKRGSSYQVPPRMRKEQGASPLTTAEAPQDQDWSQPGGVDANPSNSNIALGNWSFASGVPAAEVIEEDWSTPSSGPASSGTSSSRALRTNRGTSAALGDWSQPSESDSSPAAGDDWSQPGGLLVTASIGIAQTVNRSLSQSGQSAAQGCDTPDDMSVGTSGADIESGWSTSHTNSDGRGRYHNPRGGQSRGGGQPRGRGQHQGAGQPRGGQLRGGGRRGRGNRGD